MSKAYDRVSWEFLCLFLRAMGFGEGWIDIIWRLVSNIWYSININGTRSGFFNSSRGLRQGDPLSPSLFVICAELLSRLMNKLPENADIRLYAVDKHSPMITHLSYADDTILFTSGDLESIRLKMINLKIYEETSGQLINKEKSSFLVAPKASQNFIEEIKMMKGFQHKHFPMTFLGAPINVGRKKVYYFNDMITKVTNRLQRWNNKLISAGGRAILVKLVLYSLSMHIMAATDPPMTTLNHIEKRECIEAKYCKRIHPVAKKWRHGQSHIWRRLMEIKHVVEPLTLWKPNAAECSFWWDDWSGMGLLAKFEDQGPKPGKIQLKQMHKKTILLTSFSRAGKLNMYGNISFIKPLNEAHSFVLQCVPSIICWELWKQRCAAKYEGSYASVQSLLDRVQSLIIMLLKVHYKGIKWQDDWVKICRFLEGFKPPMKALKVMWSLPPSDRLELNTDGSSNVMKRVVGIGGIVRDSSGKLVMAYAKALHFCTNNTAETQAALFGIEWITFNRIHNVILEMDSLLIVNILNGSSSPFLEIHDDILKIKKSIQSHRIEVQHCYRKGNSVADTLSKYGATLDILPIATIFLNVQDLPKETVGVYQMNRRQMPSFRFRRSKMKNLRLDGVG
ncbi:uncharacterized protein [Nicotiana sylvestris]|uniref:uncharacterized protein n=1 Tax=Nicotiana sylvestris TaxID=4096 RepID=UPI00388CDDD4